MAREKIFGWKAICARAGWSATQIRRFEREGLKIHREPHGGTTRVWVFLDDLESFLDGREPYQPRETNGEPEKNGNSAPQRTHHEPPPKQPVHVFAAWGLSLVLLLLIGVRACQLITAPGIPEDYIRVERTITGDGLVGQVDLITSKGRMHPIWSQDSLLEMNRVPPDENTVEYRDQLQFVPGDYEYPAVFTQLFVPEATTVACMTGDYRLPSLDAMEVRLGNGMVLNDFYFAVNVKLFDDGFFHGWVTIMSSRHDHLSAICILDRDFEWMSRIYHPGHTRNCIPFVDYIAVPTMFNAREDPEARYRISLYFLRLTQALIKPQSQVLAFSPITIPTPERRDYYQAADVPRIEPELYLSGAPGANVTFASAYVNEPGFESRLLVWRALFGEYKNPFYALTPHAIQIDRNLRVQSAYVVDYELPNNEDFPLFFENLRYQRWEGDHWSEWMGATRE